MEEEILNLHLVLTHHWYDEIQAGRKRIEYREMSKFWDKRIWDKWCDGQKIKTVTFARGYTDTTSTYAVDAIDIGVCPYPEWNGLYYRIYFS